ncbi:MAG: hypothetical protein JW990_15610 [Thermoleophilia bacterium]|nr:hypothetical protein [Thermoleophilia bacterium]
MKRSCIVLIGALLFGVLIGGLLAACGDDATTTTAGPTETTAAAPTTTLSSGDSGADWPNIIWNTVKGLSKGTIDIEWWQTTEAAQKTAEYQRNVFLFKNEMDPAVLAYWEGLGMKKEMHDAGDELLKWASYTPAAALESGNTAVYPVVFDFVGGERLIFSAEGHGFAHVGAKEGFITICPTNPLGVESAALTPGGQVVRILDALEAGGYPIDRSRVYVVGMSMGGVATAAACLEFPEVVAAGAMHSSLSVLNSAQDPESTIPFFTPAADYEKAMDYSMPLLVVAGDRDFSQLPIKTEQIIGGINLWLQVNGCPTQLSFEECMDAQATSTDEAVKAIGVVGDAMWTETIGGVEHHGAEFFREDGVRMFEIVCVTNLPHWPSGGFPELAWEFMSRFSRDAEGKLVVTE